MNRKVKGLLAIVLSLGTVVNLWMVSTNGKSCWLSLCRGTIRESSPVPSLPLSRRRSVTLTYKKFPYHLNITQYEAEFPYLQSYSCTLLQDGAGFCHSPGGKPLLLLAMKSHPSSSDRRAALRQTWAVDREVSGYRVKHLFLMATTPSLVHMNLLQEEIKEFQDILLWNFTESHHNLSLKERCFIEWLHHSCKEADFIFKGDDDELVNPEALVEYLHTSGNASCTLHGNVQRFSTVVRSGKYAVTHSLFPYLKYPIFLSGGGFVIGGNAIPDLYRASIELPIFPLDDVYLGLLAVAANVTIRHNPRFYTVALQKDICQYKKALVVHAFWPDRLVEVWRQLHEPKCEPKVGPTSMR